MEDLIKQIKELKYKIKNLKMYNRDFSFMWDIEKKIRDNKTISYEELQKYARLRGLEENIELLENILDEKIEEFKKRKEEIMIFFKEN